MLSRWQGSWEYRTCGLTPSASSRTRSRIGVNNQLWWPISMEMRPAISLRYFAKDASIGCLRARNPFSSTPCSIHISHTLHGVVQAGTYDLVIQGFLAGQIARCPLNDRSWCLQEQFLSRRTIHCGARQLFWGCLECVSHLIEDIKGPKDLVNDISTCLAINVCNVVPNS